MKRIITMLLLAAVCSANALAQKGMSGLGVDVPLSLGQGTTAMGLGVRYYYNVSDYVRLGPSVEVLPFRSSGDKDPNFPHFRAFLNCHLFVMPLRPSRPYIIAGAGYVSYKYKYNDWTGIAHDDACCCDLGLGYDFRLSHSFSMQIEATGMGCIACVDDGRNDAGSIALEGANGHAGNWTFLARVGITYNF